MRSVIFIYILHLILFINHRLNNLLSFNYTMRITQVLFFVLKHVRKNAIKFYIYFFLLVSETIVINKETTCLRFPTLF